MPATTFLRLLAADDKAAALRAASDTLRTGMPLPDVYTVDPASFRQVPGAPFAYWVSERVRKLFTELPPFEADGRMVRQGGVTGDDPRYLRAHWEVDPAQRITRDVAWVPYVKGGGTSPYWQDIILLVHWDFERGTFFGFTGLPHRPSIKPSSADLYFLSGLSWARRTYRFSPYIVPRDCIFSVSRYQAFLDEDDLAWALGLMNGTAVTALLRLSLENYERPNYVVGIVAKLPVPSPSREVRTILAEAALRCARDRRSLLAVQETSLEFVSPTACMEGTLSLSEASTTWQSKIEVTASSLEPVMDSTSTE